MSTSRAVARALPMTFAIFVFEALCAVSAALPLALELARKPALRLLDAADQAAVLTLPLELAPAFRVAATQASLALGALLLISPWLQMSWLAALDQPRSLRSALLLGARRVPQAFVVSACSTVVLLVLALPFGLLAFALGRVFDPAANAKLHDLVVLQSLAPVALVLLWLVPVHDLARAEALHRPALGSVRHALRLAVRRPSVLLRALVFFVAGSAIALTAQVVVGAAAAAPFRTLTTVAILQSALFTRLVIRSGWLAGALACASSRDGPGVGPFERGAS
jgi:hypothetical protein